MGDELGSRIRTRREALGISLVGLAQMTDLSSDYVEHVELGTVQPSPRDLHQIASALATTAEELQGHGPR